MNKKIWGIIIVIAALAIIAGIVYIIFFYKFSGSPAPVIEQPAAQEQPKTVEPVSEKPIQTAATAQEAVSPLKKAEVGKDDLARMAAAFAERFGSFSNQSDYGNIRDLQIFMTSSMKSWSDNYINDARAKKTQTTIYYGIVTKAIANEIKQFDADTGRAEILIKTQRRESVGVAGNGAAFYQEAVIKYVRERGVWLLDGIYWQSR